MALSTDGGSLIAGGRVTKLLLGFINSTNGAIINSYTTNLVANYYYIEVSDSRALCLFHSGGDFQLINTTDLTIISFGSFVHPFQNGAFINSTHFALAMPNTILVCSNS